MRLAGLKYTALWQRFHQFGNACVGDESFGESDELQVGHSRQMQSALLGLFPLAKHRAASPGLVLQQRKRAAIESRLG